MKGLDIAGIGNTVNDILRNQVASGDRQAALKQLLGMIDLTTLGGDDTHEKVTDLCKQAKSPFLQTGLQFVAQTLVALPSGLKPLFQN